MTPTARPDWLPDHIPFDREWDSFIQTVYKIFKSDFIISIPRFRSLPVWHDRRVDKNDRFGFEEGFWHLVTKDERVYDKATRRSELNRLPDFNRAGRLPWAKPIIANSDDGSVLVWDYEDETCRRKAVRTYLWLKQHDFLVILEKQSAAQRQIYRLITSFHITYAAKRKDLESRYAKQIQKTSPKNG